MSKKLPKISIIIPCYNLGEYLDACLDSISKQPDGDVEYIFVNDGSTDNTLKKLEDYIKNHPDCKLLSQKNAGVSAARNAALDVCSGDYIYLLDGDDILTDNAVRLMLEDLSNDKVDLIISQVEKIRNGQNIPIILPFKEGLFSPRDLYKSVTYFHPAPQLLYRRSIIERYALKFNSNLSLGEVYDFTVRFMVYAKLIKVVENGYFMYVTRSASATQAPNYLRDITIINTIKEYNHNGKGLRDIPSFKLTNFKMMLGFTYNKYLKQRLNNPETYDAIKQLLSNPIAKECISNIIRCKEINFKDRIFAIFIKLTGVSGYKLLNMYLKRK